MLGRKVRRSLSLKEASAYKAQAEGKAALVTAWMPLILLVAGSCIIALCLLLGLDTSKIKPLADLISAVSPFK